jgi:ferric enterobactin receptor
VGPGLSISNLAGYTLQRNNAGQLLISPTTGLPLKDNNFRNVGDRNPDYKMGIINNFTIAKDVSLSFNIDIRKGGDVFNGNKMMMTITGVGINTLDREQPRVVEGVLADGLENTANPTKNTITIVPYYRSDFYNSMYTEADFIESVNWVRLRDVTLSYRLPVSLVKRQKLIKGASVYVTGTDLFLLTNYSGVDPNVSSLNASTRGIGGSGIDFGSIPTTRGLNVGIKAQF